MRITRITATPVNIPLEAPMYWTAGHYPGTAKVIIEIETDAGIVGLGEAPSPDCAATVTEQLTPRLIGQDPLDIAGCESRCVPAWQIVQNTDDSSIVKAFGGLEIALWAASSGGSPSTSCWAAPCARTSRSPSTSPFAPSRTDAAAR
jgi:glucarate dehydratase